MRKHLHILSVAITALFAQPVFAQLPPMYEQYQLNQLTFNPAYAGSKGMLEAAAFLHRQNVNFEEGAPGNQSLTLHLPVANDKIGLGMKFFHDEVGVTNTSSFAFDYAYRAHLSNNLTASFGIEASLTNYRVNASELDAFNAGDPSFTDALESYWKPNLGLGIYLHSDNYYVGLSTISLVGLTDDSGQQDGATYDDYFDQVNTVYATAGGLIPLTDALVLKPSGLLKMSDALPVQLDAGLNLIYSNVFMFGGSYRTNKSFSIVAEYLYNFDNKINRHEAGIGYAYNTSFVDDALFLSPSHEVFLIYRFDKHNNKIVNPRFF